MRLDRDEARRRLTEAAVARLATVRPDGRPHAVPVCFAVLGETAYSATDDKPKSSTSLQRVANIDTNPHAVLLVDHYDADWTRLWWVRADGDARVVTDDGERLRAIAALRAKYHQYENHRLDGQILGLEITTWSGWAAVGVRHPHGTAPDGTAAGGR